MPLNLIANWQDRAAACIERWKLADVEWLPQVSTARVASCEGAFGPTILKVSLESSIIGTECKALGIFGSEICPKVFAKADDLDAMLMARIDSLGDLSGSYPDPIREIGV